MVRHLPTDGSRYGQLRWYGRSCVGRPRRFQFCSQQGVNRVASNTSKTARASVRAGQATGGALSVLGEFKYIIPLNGGKHVYVRNLTNGKTNHLRTDSDAFAQ